MKRFVSLLAACIFGHPQEGQAQRPIEAGVPLAGDDDPDRRSPDQAVVLDVVACNGQHVMPGTGLRAAMLMKELCSYPWVRETYGAQLPDAPWIVQPRTPAAFDQRATGT